MKESLSTQQFVDIAEIKNGVVVLKNGGLRKILMVSGINVALKSEEEQNLITYSYQNFLNTLDFSVQFFIHSRRININKYLGKLEERRIQEPNELLKNQISEYTEFIRTFVELNDVMTKTFFAVVPYEAVEIASVAKGLFGGIKNSLSGILGTIGLKGVVEEKAPRDEKQEFEKKLIQLDRRTEIVINGLNQIGLRTVVLNDEELIELFYNLYNPEAIEKKELKIARE